MESVVPNILVQGVAPAQVGRAGPEAVVETLVTNAAPQAGNRLRKHVLQGERQCGATGRHTTEPDREEDQL